MANVVEAAGVVGDGELLNAGNVVGVFNGDGGVIGEVGECRRGSLTDSGTMRVSPC
jgi:hypothetical protein